jgi:hypothetical protein
MASHVLSVRSHRMPPLMHQVSQDKCQGAGIVRLRLEELASSHHMLTGIQIIVAFGHVLPNRQEVLEVPSGGAYILPAEDVDFDVLCHLDHCCVRCHKVCYPFRKGAFLAAELNELLRHPAHAVNREELQV